MNNPYINYYRNQAGSGIAGFQGAMYQRGHGFFGNLWSGIKSLVKPLLGYLGNVGLATSVNVGKDVLKGQNFKESILKNLKITGEQLIDDAAQRGKTFIQTGKGRGKRSFSAAEANRSKNRKSAKGKKSKRSVRKKQSPLTHLDFL